MKSARDKWPSIVVVLMLNLSCVLSGWSSWGQFTQCSRPCDGGVKYRERSCVVDRLDRSVCKGKTISYRLCNTHACEGVSRDFRANQCSKYNNVPLDGVLYTWRPYYGNGENCRLLCFPDGFPFYHKFADKVIDGTPCMEDDSRRCIDGHCKSVGCDNNIGSKKTVDLCGVCGGDNSTCRRRNRDGDVTGFFDQTLSPGHTTIVEIPIGATNIYIREMGPNKNSIVFWDNSGLNFAIDKETRKVSPSVDMAGTKFLYQAADRENTYGGIQAAGPIASVVTVYAVNEGADNPGIRYGYSMPSSKPRIFTPPKKVNNQGRQPYSESRPSNLRVAEPDVAKPAFIKPGNIQVRTSHVPSDNRRTHGLTHVRIVDRQSVDSIQSSYNRKETPDQSRQYVYANNVQVFGGDNSIQEKLYGGMENTSKVERDQILKNEIQTGRREQERARRPVNPDNNYDSYRANDVGYLTRNNLEERRRGDDRRLENVRDRNSDNEGRRSRDWSSSPEASDERYMWSYGHWTECSSQCGTGVQRRIVSCVDRLKRETTEERLCPGNQQPSSSQPCSNGDCRSDSPSSYVRWQVGSWGACSTSCEIGDQVQEVFCEAVFEDGTSKVVDDEQCLLQYRAKPQYRRSCNDGVPCDTPRYMWKFSDWRPCSVACGDGVQSRRVDCRMMGNNGRVPADKCASDLRPVDRRRCNLADCPRIQRGERPADCRRSRFGCCPDGSSPKKTENDNCMTVGQVHVRTGNRAVLDCRPDAETVEWTKQGLDDPVYKQARFSRNIHPRYNGRAKLVDNSKLEIYPAHETDSGLYTCSGSLYVGERKRLYRNQVFLDVRGK